MYKLIKIGKISFKAAVPAILPRPAYCEPIYEYRERLVFISFMNCYITVPERVKIGERCFKKNSGRPAIPASQSLDPKTGWNAGAISVRTYKNNVKFSFNLNPTASGIICGISQGAAERSYSSVAHGFIAKLADDGLTKLAIIENGKIIYDIGSTFTNKTSFNIIAYNGKVTYYIDDNKIITTPQNVINDIYAECVLYAITDYVDNPVFQPYSENVVLTKIKLNLRASDNQENKVILKLNKLKAASDTGNFSNNVLPKLIARIGDNNILANGLNKLIVKAFVDNSPKPRINYVNAYICRPLIALPYVRNGGKGEVNAKLNRIKSFSTDQANFIRANLVIKGINSVIKSNPLSDKIEITELITVKDNISSYLSHIIIFTENIFINNQIDLFFLTSVDFTECISVHDNYDLKSLLKLFINEELHIINSNSNFSSTELNQYAVNLENYAISLYKGFDFIGFANSGGKTYGIKQDGLYLIKSGLDDGNKFDCEIDLGARDFGNSNLKKVSSAYIGVRTDGQLYLKVEVDKQHYNIYSFNNNNASCEQRTFMSKGAIGKYWRMKLQLEDQSFANIDNIEFEVNVSNRRLRG